MIWWDSAEHRSDAGLGVKPGTARCNSNRNRPRLLTQKSRKLVSLCTKFTFAGSTKLVGNDTISQWC